MLGTWQPPLDKTPHATGTIASVCVDAGRPLRRRCALGRHLALALGRHLALALALALLVHNLRINNRYYPTNVIPHTKCTSENNMSRTSNKTKARSSL